MSSSRTDRQDQREQRSWVFAIALAWIFPGLGHWYLGRRHKAVIFAVCIVGLFVTGLIFTHGRAVNYNDTLLFVGQSLSGFIAFIAGYAGQQMALSGPPAVLPVRAEMGSLYTLIAGLLNLLVVVDAFMVGNNIQRTTVKGGFDRV
jgi:hypothetical protein